VTVRTGATLLALLVAASVRAATGPEIYAEACATCHGVDGRGAPAGTRIEVPLPDFTDCNVSTAEATGNWAKLVRRGGPALGMSSQMPAFGDALSDDELAAVLAYLRAFCRDPRFPDGDLNYRRPVFVEKAFPEDEFVVTGSHEVARRERVEESEVAIEKRIGPRGQLEVALPAGATVPDEGRNAGGVGDLAVSYRHVLLAAPGWRTIVSGGAELVLPTGNFHHGIGSGTTTVAPQLLSGHALGPIVAQVQLRAELPADPDRADRQMVYRLALQYPLGPSKRALVPALELEQTQAIASDVHAATLLGPTLYLPLSRRGHTALGIGAQLPVAGTRPFDWRLGAFFLWEYRDGPIWAW